jgi:hypothetical protein
MRKLGKTRNGHRSMTIGCLSGCLSGLFFLAALGFYVWWQLSGDWLFGHYRGPRGFVIVAQVFGCLSLAMAIVALVAWLSGRRNGSEP